MIANRPVPAKLLMRLSIVSGLLLSVATLPTSASPQAAASRDSAVKLPGMTVTATRNAAPIIRTPLAVSKITAADLRAVSGLGLDEALAKIPGVIAQSRYGTGDIRLMIRGYGSRGAGDRSNSGTTRGVRVLIDGFPETEPDGRTALDQLDLASAEAVEVIRSNASSVWGNAAGGVVNMLTAPAPARPSFDVQPMFGAYGLARYAVRSAMPIGDGAGVIYANFTNTSFDGWRDHSDTRRQLVNGGAVGQVGDRTRLGLYLTVANNLMHVPGPLTQAQVDANPRQANATYAARDERRYNRTGRLGVSVDHDVNATMSVSSMLYVNPKYLQRSERNTFRDFTRYHIGGNMVARMAINGGTTRQLFTVGVDDAYQDGAILFYNLGPGNTRGTALADNKGEGANNFGAFFQDEFTVNDRLTLLLGARYDNVKYNYRSYMPTAAVRADSRDYSRVTPKIGVNWLINPTHSIYANFGGGIEVPAGNETDPTPGAPPTLLNPLLDAIRSNTIEAGFKSRPVLSRGNALGYEVAFYNINITNEIIPYNGGRYYLTAGKARRQGVELGLNGQTSAGLFATAAVTLSGNKYLEYVVDSAVIFPNDPTKAGRRAVYDDNKVVGVPDALANIELGTEIPGARGLRFKVGIEHSGDYFADDANRVTIPSYTIFNLTAELHDPIVAANGVGVRGFLSIRNVTDKDFIGSAFLNPDLVGGAPAAFEPGTPRALIVSLSIGRLR